MGGPIQYVFDKGHANEHSIKKLFERILSELSAEGYEILSAHRYENYGEMDVSNKEREVSARDFSWMVRCDLFIAVLLDDGEGRPIRTDGTCVELGWASALGKKIIIIHSEQARYSHLVAGLDAVANVRYVNIDDINHEKRFLIEIVSHFLGEFFDREAANG